MIEHAHKGERVDGRGLKPMLDSFLYLKKKEQINYEKAFSVENNIAFSFLN